MIIAALIFVVSFAALLQFFLSYCRSIIAASRQQAFSDDVREIVGTEQAVPSEEFGRLVQLVEICPGSGDDRFSLRAVRAYYALLNLLDRLVPGNLGSNVDSWVEQERANCAYFAAIALGRRIAFSRDLVAQQAANLF
jgi:uncharacterized protein YidB (DUF937 family)